MTDTLFAIESAEESGRVYLAGSPFFASRLWAGGDTRHSLTMQRAVKGISAVGEATMKFEDLGQQALTVTFATHRVYDSVRAALLAAFRQPNAHLWAGTAVMLVRVHGSPTEWHVYRGSKAVVGCRWHVDGSTVFLNYTLRLGQWVLEGSTEKLVTAGDAIVDGLGFPILDGNDDAILR
jgi:hypothetical protein